MMEFIAKVICRDKISPEIFKVTLRFLNSSFSFKAGQYVKLTLPPLVEDDGHGFFRHFSICSSPNDFEKIEVIFRPSKSCFKRILMDDSLDFDVKVSSPQGIFTLPEDVLCPVVFVAAGVGITPCLSMIRYAKEKSLPFDITLIHIGHDTQSFLSELPKDGINYYFSDAFSKDFLLNIQNRRPNSRYYVSGPPLLVDQIIKNLYMSGIDESDILQEHFKGY